MSTANTAAAPASSSAAERSNASVTNGSIGAQDWDAYLNYEVIVTVTNKESGESRPVTMRFGTALRMADSKHSQLLEKFQSSAYDVTLEPQNASIRMKDENGAGIGGNW